MSYLICHINSYIYFGCCLFGFAILHWMKHVYAGRTDEKIQEMHLESYSIQCLNMSISANWWLMLLFTGEVLTHSHASPLVRGKATSFSRASLGNSHALHMFSIECQTVFTARGLGGEIEITVVECAPACWYKFVEMPACPSSFRPFISFMQCHELDTWNHMQYHAISCNIMQYHAISAWLSCIDNYRCVLSVWSDDVGWCRMMSDVKIWGEDFPSTSFSISVASCILAIDTVLTLRAIETAAPKTANVAELQQRGHKFVLLVIGLPPQIWDLKRFYIMLYYGVYIYI